jgi:hypothetical protein
MRSNDFSLTMLAAAFRRRKGYHLDISFQFTQPGVPDFQVSGQLDVMFPGSLLFTTESKEGLVTAATTDAKGFTRLNFPKSEAMHTPMLPSRSRISRCLAGTAMFDDGLAEILAGLVPYGDDISLIRDTGAAVINEIPCVGYIVDVGKKTSMSSSVTVFVGRSDQQLYRFVSDHPTVKGAQRTVTLSAPGPIQALPKNPKVTDKGMQKMTAEPEFGGTVIIGKMAPPVFGTTLLGKPFDLDTPTKAKAHIVHFWSMSDSNSCLQVIDIQRAISPFPKGTIQVISICLDHVQNSQRVKQLWTRMGATWQTIVDPLGPDSDAARTWQTDAPGGIVILSRSGKVQSLGLRSTDITDAVNAAMRLP